MMTKYIIFSYIFFYDLHDIMCLYIKYRIIVYLLIKTLFILHTYPHLCNQSTCSLI